MGYVQSLDTQNQESKQKGGRNQISNKKKNNIYDKRMQMKYNQNDINSALLLEDESEGIIQYYKNNKKVSEYDEIDVDYERLPGFSGLIEESSKPITNRSKKFDGTNPSIREFKKTSQMEVKIQRNNDGIEGDLINNKFPQQNSSIHSSIRVDQYPSLIASRYDAQKPILNIRHLSNERQRIESKKLSFWNSGREDNNISSSSNQNLSSIRDSQIAFCLKLRKKATSQLFNRKIQDLFCRTKFSDNQQSVVPGTSQASQVSKFLDTCATQQMNKDSLNKFSGNIKLKERNINKNNSKIYEDSSLFQNNLLNEYVQQQQQQQQQQYQLTQALYQQSQLQQQQPNMSQLLIRRVYNSNHRSKPSSLNEQSNCIYSFIPNSVSSSTASAATPVSPSASQSQQQYDMSDPNSNNFSNTLNMHHRLHSRVSQQLNITQMQKFRRYQSSSWHVSPVKAEHAHPMVIRQIVPSPLSLGNDYLLSKDKDEEKEQINSENQPGLHKSNSSKDNNNSGLNSSEKPSKIVLSYNELTDSNTDIAGHKISNPTSNNSPVNKKKNNNNRSPQNRSLPEILKGTNSIMQTRSTGTNADIQQFSLQQLLADQEDLNNSNYNFNKKTKSNQNSQISSLGNFSGTNNTGGGQQQQVGSNRNTYFQGNQISQQQVQKQPSFQIKPFYPLAQTASNLTWKSEIFKDSSQQQSAQLNSQQQQSQQDDDHILISFDRIKYKTPQRKYNNGINNKIIENINSNSKQE